ncbi:hypothetical protein [Pedobacter nanyangensis]|uniref:hypothetical protein n=1 Tax=Pedobacter nanyangensis TaxID=1562389 RepID=UPI000DE2CB85|nr:hypothetical protein [Pedobacter nanyangensis]
MKDIFIDNNVAKNFSNPLDNEYKKLIEWIINYDESIVAVEPDKKKDFAHLVVNQKLLTEYLRSSYNCFHSTSMPMIIALLTRQGRLIKHNNSLIGELKSQLFSKKILRNILSNEEDHCHICTIIQSNRKKALTYDENLTIDLKSFPNYNIEVSDRPEKIGYE